MYQHLSESSAFVEDMTKTFWISFFMDTAAVLHDARNDDKLGVVFVERV